MNEKGALPRARINEKKFDFLIFFVSFAVLAVLFTVQNRLLGDFIQYTEIPISKVVAIISCWMIAAALFTVATSFMVRQNYRKPMEKFAEATHKVAGGDFTVFVSPRRRADKLDYLDAIFMDFNKMVEELGSIETLKTDFFSNVSHEIKTPLAVINNYANMLQNENLSPERRKDYTTTILEASRRLNDLITNILKLNRLEKQSISPVSEPYDLCGQLCESALMFEDRWEAKDIEFVTDIEDRVIIDADASLLELAWNNLLSNAIKFTPQGGTVTLTQTSTEKEVVVSVSDTGCGMDEDTLQHVFDKFYQGDTSHATEGNGLGLALVKRIVDLMMGSLSVESAVGKGSTFTIRLPLRHESDTPN